MGMTTAIDDGIPLHMHEDTRGLHRNEVVDLFFTSPDASYPGTSTHLIERTVPTLTSIRLSHITWASILR